MTLTQRMKQLEAEMASLKIEIEEDDWVTVKPGKWWITNHGSVYNTHNSLAKDLRSFGVSYHTKAQAEKARNEMKKINLIRYYATILDAESEDDLVNSIYYIPMSGKYSWVRNNLEFIGAVLMSESTAKKIVAKLNSGELVLS